MNGAPVSADGTKKPTQYSSRAVKVGRNIWFFVLLAVVAVGIVVTGTLSVMSEYVPTHKKVIFRDGKDIEVLLTTENNLQVPVQNYIVHKTSLVVAEIYFKNLPIFIKDVKLSSNSSSNSSSIITVKDADMVNRTDRSGVYQVPIELGHSLIIKNFSEPYSVDIYYRKGNDSGQVLVEKIPFTWSASTLDFGKPSYFWIIFLGVILSRVFTFTKDESGSLDASTHLTSLELIWVPFSAVITLLIFSSFRQQVNLTSDVMINLALAFGFGFGFDKIFEVWAKAPKKAG